MSEIRPTKILPGILRSLGLSFFVVLAPAWAVTPMEYYNSLVAGGDGAGFRDGAFVSARFTDPAGLVFGEGGHRLYVADSGNHRVRVVDLDRNNTVGTVAGTGSSGTADGSLAAATFDSPKKLAVLPGERLAVFDAGNGSIRLIDLQKRTVSTLAQGIKLQDMVYRPQDGNLYFSEPETHKIEKMDMKTLKVSAFVSDNIHLTSPGALCLAQEGLCVADNRSATIYQLLPAPPSSSPATPALSAVGKATEVLGLSSSDGALYALLKGGSLVKVGFPRSAVIEFPTAWGFTFKNKDHNGVLPLLDLQEDGYAGFLASPTEPRKFFISTEHSIISVKDYDFKKWWSAIKDNSRHLTDFDYPVKKPAGTFRILTVGSSRNSTSVPLPDDPNGRIDENVDSPRALTFSKRLEFLLNAEASLQNVGLHFEVLNVTHRGEPLSTFGYYVVPEVVKKYDIDLVLGLAGESGYQDYYARPMTSQGIPAGSVDFEYLQQPLSDRAKSAVAVDLLKRCKVMGIPVSDKQDFPGDGLWSLFCSGDAQLQKDLVEMAGRRLQLLDKELGSMKTSRGNATQFFVFYAPGGTFPNDCSGPFWGEVCAQYHLKFLDLSDSFNALKTAYFPVYIDHFTAFGNDLVALLLYHQLVDKKIVPFHTIPQ